VHFLLTKSSNPMWKGGVLSEREVTETVSVQSPACLPYWLSIPP
jgi:hypothetical protein